MVNTYQAQKIYQKTPSDVSLPKEDKNAPVSTSEKLVKIDLEKLSENANEIKKIKETLKDSRDEKVRPGN